ncbi:MULTISPECIES: hypothetical protein [Microbacterium]|nr:MULTISPECIES: hypothetical protein [Microbacterium]
MREHIEILVTGLATVLRGDARKARRRAPRRARGTFVPVAPDMRPTRFAH